MADLESEVCFSSEFTSKVDFSKPCKRFPFTKDVFDTLDRDSDEKKQWTLVKNFETSMKTKFDVTFPINFTINMNFSLSRNDYEENIEETSVIIDFKEKYFREIKNVEIKLMLIDRYQDKYETNC